MMFSTTFNKAFNFWKSKNVRVQREKVFGKDPNPSRYNPQRQKQMKHIAKFTKKEFGAKMTIAEGKRDEKGKLKQKKQKPFNILGSEKEVTKEKKYSERLQKKGKRRTDPKPDWRSGNIETQPSVDAAIHELAHLRMGRKGMGVKKLQTHMDKEWGESQKKHGHLKQKHTTGEIAPMAMENPLRREMGLPATGGRKEKGHKKDKRLDDPKHKMYHHAYDPKTGQKVSLSRQSRLATKKEKARQTKRRYGVEEYSPKKGFGDPKSIHGKINKRAWEKKERAMFKGRIFIRT